MKGFIKTRKYIDLVISRELNYFIVVIFSVAFIQIEFTQAL